MKNVLALTAFLAFGLVSEAAAQVQDTSKGGDDPGGSSWGTISGNKNGMGSPSKWKDGPMTVCLRCYKDPVPATLIAALQRVTGVSDIEVDAENRILRATIPAIDRLEAVMSTASVNGVPVALLSPVPLSARCQAKGKEIDIKAMVDGARKTHGLRHVTFSDGGAMEAVADFQFFDHVAFRAMADKAGFDVSFKGFESVTVSLSAASTPELEKRLLSTKGVLRFKADGETVRLWTVEGISEVSITDAAKAAGLEIRGILRKG